MFRVFLLVAPALCLLVWGTASTVYGGETNTPVEKVPGVLDFQSAVHEALQHSPDITQSQLQIDVQRLGESDAKLSYIPRVALSTSYYPNPPDGTSSLSAITFVVGPYNPVESYFSVKGAKLIREAAVISHKLVIENGLYELAGKYLELDSVSNMIETQKQVVDQTSERAGFIERLADMGETAELERELAFQDLAVAQAEQQKLEASRAAVVEEIKSIIGMTEDQQPLLDARDAHRQVLAGFDPHKVTYEDVRKNSFILQLQEKQTALQSLSSAKAYAQFIPTVSLGVRNPDPLGDSTANNDLYAYFGINIVLWDGYKRVNEISRQELKSRQFNEKSRAQMTDIKSQWLTANRLLRAAEVNLKLAKSNEKLMELRERKTEITYQGGNRSVTKADLITARIVHLEAVKRRLSMELERDQAILKIRHATNDLFNKHVRVISTEEQ